MPQTVLITVTSIGVDNSSTFNIYSDTDNYIIPFDTNISASSLLAGYTSNNVPDGTVRIKLKSTSGVCDYEPVLGIMINAIPQPSHTPTPTPTNTPTPTPTPTATPIPPTPTPTPTPTPVPPTTSYRYIATSNWGGYGSNSKIVSNLCITQNTVTNCRIDDSWFTGNDNTESVTGITVGTYPLTITRDLKQNLPAQPYTQTITGYTVQVLINSVLVWSTGYTYSPALTIPTTPSIDGQSVTTSGITINGGDIIDVIWSDACYSPNLPTPTPTPSSTPTPTPTPLPPSFYWVYTWNNARTCSKTFDLEYSFDSGSTWTNYASITRTTQTSYTGSTISITGGTFGFRTRIKTCKETGCASLIRDFYNTSLSDNVDGFIVSTGSTNDNTVPVCPTTVTSTVASYGNITFVNGRIYSINWDDTFKI